MKAYTFHLLVCALHVLAFGASFVDTIFKISWFSLCATGLTLAICLTGGALAWCVAPVRTTPSSRHPARAVYIVYAVTGVLFSLYAVTLSVLGWVVIAKLGTPSDWDPTRSTRAAAVVMGVGGGIIAVLTAVDVWVARMLVPPPSGVLGDV